MSHSPVAARWNRVVHFRACRRTRQTPGVRHGTNQRSAQELLGHSDPRLTANVYTDVPALALHAVIGKLPFLGDARIDAHSGDRKVSVFVRRGFRDVLNDLIRLAREVVFRG